MALFLTVLKVIGIILLVLLGVLLLALLLVLFVPARYKVKLLGNGSLKEPEVRGRLSFLWFVLRARVDYPGERLYCVRFFGFPILKDGEEEKAEPSQETEGTLADGSAAADSRQAAKADPADGLSPDGCGELSDGADQETDPAVPSPAPKTDFTHGDPVYRTPEEQEWGWKAPGGEPSFAREWKTCSAYSKIRALCGRIKGLYERLRTLFSLLGKESTKEAGRELLFRTRKILWSVRPRRLEGEVSLGLSDPAATGILFGALALLDTDRLNADPDFDQERFSGEVSIRGRVICGVVLYHVLRLILKPEVRSFWEEFSRWNKEREQENV